jgi:hypothetical protein
MGGGLMQLVAYGAQDVYLTGNPQITFFKVVYRRHTNFSMEYIRQTPNGSKSSQSITIGRNGDLIYDIFIEKNDVNLDNIPTMIEIEIGGQLIDRQDDNFIKTYLELTEKNPNGCQNSLLQKNLLKGNNRHARIPLTFWFCRNPGVAIPLIALQYHEVKLNVEDTTGELENNIYWVNYIYLDTDERRRFAQVSHEYLIEQVQMQTSETIKTGRNTYDLIFNHPVKELIWTVEKQELRHIKNTWQLKLNGQDRFSKMDQYYFTRLQTWKYHSGSSLVKQINHNYSLVEDYKVQSGIASNVDTDRIHVYSFALKPEEHQPSGTCNFSRIDSSRLILNNNSNTPDRNDPSAGDGKLNIYAINYNVLRVMSGMGGLAYSN